MMNTVCTGVHTLWQPVITTGGRLPPLQTTPPLRRHPSPEGNDGQLTMNNEQWTVTGA
ncbi:MAG: hypothetical protein FWH14_06250 [Oscillospiraceae bacterium]|nr:hypothetical protein [Oscillospiraceae bacterium]